MHESLHPRRRYMLTLNFFKKNYLFNIYSCIFLYKAWALINFHAYSDSFHINHLNKEKGEGKFDQNKLWDPNFAWRLHPSFPWRRCATIEEIWINNYCTSKLYNLARISSICLFGIIVIFIFPTLQITKIPHKDWQIKNNIYIYNFYRFFLLLSILPWKQYVIAAKNLEGFANNLKK